MVDHDWDMLFVAHPPCTRLCNSGVRWLSKPPPGKTLDEMWEELDEGADLFSEINVDILPKNKQFFVTCSVCKLKESDWVALADKHRARRTQNYVS